MEIYTEQAEADAKVTALVSRLVEFKSLQSHKNNHVYEVDGFRISIGPSYKDADVMFRVYSIKGDTMKLVRVGRANEVFDILPERFAQAMLFQLDLLQ